MFLIFALLAFVSRCQILGTIGSAAISAASAGVGAAKAGVQAGVGIARARHDYLQAPQDEARAAREAGEEPERTTSSTTTRAPIYYVPQAVEVQRAAFYQLQQQLAAIRNRYTVNIGPGYVRRRLPQPLNVGYDMRPTPYSAAAWPYLTPY